MTCSLLLVPLGGTEAVVSCQLSVVSCQLKRVLRLELFTIVLAQDQKQAEDFGIADPFR